MMSKSLSIISKSSARDGCRSETELERPPASTLFSSQTSRDPPSSRIVPPRAWIHFKRDTPARGRSRKRNNTCSSRASRKGGPMTPFRYTDTSEALKPPRRSSFRSCASINNAPWLAFLRTRRVTKSGHPSHDRPSRMVARGIPSSKRERRIRTNQRCLRLTVIIPDGGSRLMAPSPGTASRNP